MRVPALKSKDFILRPFKSSDEKSLKTNINNKRVSRTLLEVPYPYTLKDAKQWIGKNLNEPRKKNPGIVCFVIDIGGQVAGSVGLHHIKQEHQEHKAELGYWLAEKYWGRGIMTQAVKLASKFGFNKLKLRRIYAYTFYFNKASMKVLRKAGYKFEGILKKNAKKGSKFIDDYCFSRIK